MPETEAPKAHPTTRTSRTAEALLRPADRIFNRIYTSRYNPLYRSGTVAVSLLLVVLVTGFYLIFFYRISAPYESMVQIQEQIWLGRWIRALHRYASDAAMGAVAIHFLRIVAQGKSWGPRFLAWITGVLLLLFFLVSGWTGYLMVWDRFGQSLASTGARMLDHLPVFVEPVSRSFSGGIARLPQSFFFMNLFLHVAIPLGMIVGLWIHTSRIARAKWFLDRRTFIWAGGALALVSVLWPAPLGEKADLLALPGIIEVDAFFGFWLPFAWRTPMGALHAWIGAFILLAALPFIIRPRKSARPAASFNDPKLCQGCGQCVKDCPYEAIAMVPRPEGTKGSPEVALVDASVCVSCGICAGSCQSFTIGPLGRKAPDQLFALKQWLPQAPSKKILVLACEAHSAVFDRMKSLLRPHSGFELRPSECPGTLHATVIDRMARGYRAVAVVCCPPENSLHREGFDALTERLTGARTPTLGRRTVGSRILLIPTGDGEEAHALKRLLALRDGAPAGPGDHVRAPVLPVIAASVTLLIALGVAFASRVPLQASATDHGILRLSWRLPGQALRNCVKRTEAELAQLPAHMRTPEFCTTELLSYQLRLRLGDRPEVIETHRPAGLQGDRPLYVERDFRLAPGEYPLFLSFMPERQDAPAAARLAFEGRVRVSRGRIRLVTLGESNRLELVE